MRVSNRSVLRLAVLLWLPTFLGCGSSTISSLNMVPSPVTLKVNSPTQMRLILVKGGNAVEDITSSATWTALTSGGSIDRGLVTCQQPGIFQIGATFGTLNTSTAVSCIAPLPPNTPGPPTTDTPVLPSLVALRISSQPQQVVRSETP